MKRLDAKSPEVAEQKSKAKKKKTIKDDGKTISVTKTIYSKEEAIQAKMAVAEPAFLGKKLISMEQKSERHVWVPCYLLVFNFRVQRNVFFNKNAMFDKIGTVGVVYDANEMHGSSYDYLTEGNIPLKHIPKEELEGEILPDKGNEKEIMDGAETFIRRQLFLKAYKTTEGELDLIKKVKFYREAWELKLKFKDKNFTKYAYMDDYSLTNERARGMNRRLEP
ncbi:MAG: hypothetical protein IJI74_02990 [Firmicutes bacterium]|nr:hypothetical protein [Bacillota bacterium]